MAKTRRSSRTLLNAIIAGLLAALIYCGIAALYNKEIARQQYFEAAALGVVLMFVTYFVGLVISQPKKP